MATRHLPPQEYESDGDSYKVLDLTEYARRQHWWNRVFAHSSGPIVEKYSVATQIAVGGVSGWCAGFLFQKVRKLAATAVGGGFLLLQMAATEFVRQNIVIASGLVGGFLPGLAS
uniref:FUN14 domain-containing protein 1-like n=1 Tax=Bos indicus x Bos taurus TaxID=30522 RepID=A0A4W2CYT5_BOBOX